MSSLVKPKSRYSWTVPQVEHAGPGSLGTGNLAANRAADNTNGSKSTPIQNHRPVATFFTLAMLAESTPQLPVSASDAPQQSIEKTPLSMVSLPVPPSSLPVQTSSQQSVITSQSEPKTFLPMSASPLSVSSSLPVQEPPALEFLASARMHDLGPGDIRDVCRCVSGEERRFRPEGLVALPGGRVAVSDGLSNKVMVFSADGRQVGYIGHRGRGILCKPRSLAAMPNGTVAVLDASGGSVKVYSYTGDYMYTIKDWFTDRVVPLAATPEGDLILPHGQTLVVTSLTQHGPSRTSCTNVTSARDLSTARGLAASRDHVVLCGIEEDDVMLINRQSGQVEKTFTFSENVQNWNVGLRSSFFGACFDSKNNCYLTDSDNNGILMIDSEGEKVVNFHCDSWIRRATRSRAFSQLDSVLLCPKFVCMTHNGELLIVEHLGKVKKLLIPKDVFVV